MTFIQAAVFGGGGGGGNGGSGDALGHILDENTLCLWRLNEDDWSSVTDYGSLGIDLAAASLSDPHPPFYPGMGKVHINTEAGQAIKNEGAGNGALMSAMTGVVDYTVEMWVDIGLANTTAQYALALLVRGDNTVDQNNLLQFALYPSTRTIRTFFEYGESTNVDITFAGAWSTVQQAYPMHLAAVIEDDGEGNNDITLYINGAFVDTQAGKHKADTAGPSCHVHLGATILGVKVGDTRISNKARSAAEILESYNRGAVLP